MNKADIRKAALAQRDGLSLSQRDAGSQAITRMTQQLLVTLDLRLDCVLTYRSLAAEVATHSWFSQPSAYRVFAPLTAIDGSMEWLETGPATRWNRGAFGVLEPGAGAVWGADEGSTVVLCPLSAFDRQGNRLGMGKGCFDRWLSRYRAHTRLVIGLAFSCQEVAGLPVESHDVPMDYIITEKEVISCMNPMRKA